RAAAKQVAALAAEEATQQLAAARDLANDVALKTAPSDPDMKMRGATGEGDRKTPGLGSAAEDAKSLKDVLENTASAGKPSDADAARKAAGLLRQENLADAIARLEKPSVGGDRSERKDLADRIAAGNEPVPPQYKDLVERYLRALSAGGSK